MIILRKILRKICKPKNHSIIENKIQHRLFNRLHLKRMKTVILISAFPRQKRKKTVLKRKVSSTSFFKLYFELNQYSVHVLQCRYNMCSNIKSQLKHRFLPSGAIVISECSLHVSLCKVFYSITVILSSGRVHITVTRSSVQVRKLPGYTPLATAHSCC